VPKLGVPRTVLSEHVEQREYVQWFRQTYPGVRILAIPNGGARSPATAARLKAEGVCAGVPDLFVPEWGLWVEMKRAKGGKVSADQKDWLEYLDYCGYTVIVCLGKTDAINQTQNLRIQNDH
jgi:hypothetical protein